MLISVGSRSSVSHGRIEEPMITKPKSRTMLRSFAAGMSFLTILVGLNESQLGRAQSQAGASAAPQSFEVASIKPSPPQNGPGMFVRIGSSPGGRWTAEGITLSMLIQQAYDVKDYQISGAPGWMNTERYDIVAKADVPQPTREQLRVLLQSLLAERCKLQIHRETKELPIYELVVGKGGHKLHLSETQPTTDPQPPDPSKPVQAGAVAGGSTGGFVSVGPGGKGVNDGTPVKSGSMMRMGRGQLNAQMAPVSSIAAMLSQQLGRPVVDKTGIKGNYDFTLQWTPDETQRGMGLGGMEKPATDSPMPADTSGPSVFTAVQEQLGLKLEAAKGPVEILVIDHIERPSGN